MAKSLQQLVAEQTGTAAEIAVILNAKTIEVISTEIITAGTLIERLTKNQANTALTALRTDAATNESSAMWLSRLYSTGLAHIDLRGMRKTNAPDAFVNKLKDMLESIQSPCEANNLPPATVGDVQAEIDGIAAAIVAGISSQLIAFAINEVLAGQTFATWAELQAAVAASGGP